MASRRSRSSRLLSNTFAATYSSLRATSAACAFVIASTFSCSVDACNLVASSKACTAAAAALTVTVSFAGGQAGALVVLEMVALGGLLLTGILLAQLVPEPQVGTAEEAMELENVIADHAANHAAFSAQLASLSRRGANP